MLADPWSDTSGTVPCCHAMLFEVRRRIGSSPCKMGPLGYHFDVGAGKSVLDQAGKPETEKALREMGWLSETPEPCGSCGPQPQPASETAARAETRLAAGDSEESADNLENYTMRAATMLLNRLKKNRSRLAELSQEMQDMVLSDDPAKQKDLKRLLMKNGGSLEKVELETKELVEANDSERALETHTPTTKAQAG